MLVASVIEIQLAELAKLQESLSESKKRTGSEWKDPVEKKVFIPFRKCRHPVQLLFGLSAAVGKEHSAEASVWSCAICGSIASTPHPGTFLLLVGFLAFNPASTFATTLGCLG